MTPDLFEAHALVEQRHWWFTGRRAILRSVLHAIAPANRDLALVDIGCGTGGNLAGLVAGYRGIGMDPSPDAIRLARERFPLLEFVEGADPARVAGSLAGGGVALLTDVLEHVEDDRALLAAVVDVLPPGGQVIITVPADPTLWSGHDVAFGHFRRYRMSDLPALWAGLPVEVRAMTAFNTRLLPIIRLVRWWRGEAATPGGDLAIPAGPLNGILRWILAGERRTVLRALATGSATRRAGVSLLAVLRRTT